MGSGADCQQNIGSSAPFNLIIEEGWIDRQAASPGFMSGCGRDIRLVWRGAEWAGGEPYFLNRAADMANLLDDWKENETNLNPFF